jgi:hypothetical protein
MSRPMLTPLRISPSTYWSLRLPVMMMILQMTGEKHPPLQPEESATPVVAPTAQHAGQGAPVEFVSPPAGVTPTSEDGDECLRRFRTIDNIVAESAEELLLVVGEEPATFTEAEPHPAWRAAMLEEMSAIEENGTWELIRLKRIYNF